jgi:pimeloyl-ACP methyl ester carboxylesterase
MAFVDFEGTRIAYTEFGGGPAEVTASGERGRTARSAPALARPLVLLHGLLMSQEMHRPLAQELAARGNRVITVDLLGHGLSDRPRVPELYSTERFARQVLAVMDALSLEEAVVMGTSLGANTTLELAATAPGRLLGMVLEMPVLDNALLSGALMFTPLLFALTVGEPLMRLLARGARAVPRSMLPHYANVTLDAFRQEPGPGGSLLRGLFYGRIAPTSAERRTFQTPALVLGHRRDPVHRFADAQMLAEELPNARLVRASSLMELRLSPERLTGEIASFLDGVWAPAVGARRRAAGGRRGAIPRRGTVRIR